MTRYVIFFIACIAMSPAGAQWKPSQPVEIVVGTSPGSGSDRTARRIQRLLQEHKLIDVPAVVANKPGGGGTIALAFMARQSGNGHTIMVTSPSMITNHITGRTALGHMHTTPLAQLGTEAVVFAVNAASPLKSARDIAERLKADVSSLSFSIGVTIGSHNHIALAQVAKALGGDVKRLKVVAFSGSADGLTALLGGHIDVAAAPPSGVWPHAQAGKLRILAASAERRLSGALASIPTWHELGIKSVASNWRSVVGAKDLTPDQIRFWDQVLGRVAELPEWKHDLDAQQVENTYLNAAATRKLMDAQLTELRGILGDLGLAR
jgi:putative tricarboxylic transport membrane protein